MSSFVRVWTWGFLPTLFYSYKIFIYIRSIQLHQIYLSYVIAAAPGQNINKRQTLMMLEVSSLLNHHREMTQQPPSQCKTFLTSLSFIRIMFSYISLMCIHVTVTLTANLALAWDESAPLTSFLSPTTSSTFASLVPVFLWLCGVAFRRRTWLGLGNNCTWLGLSSWTHPTPVLSALFGLPPP